MQNSGNDRERVSAVDALVVTAGRPALAARCVESIASRTDAGIIVVVNGADPETLARLNALRERYPRVAVHVEQERVSKSRARNIAVSLSRADLLYFIDDDAFVEYDIAALIRAKHGQYPGAAAVGGPNITPGESTLFQRLAGYVLASPFTAWRMRARFAAGNRETECSDAMLTLCNLAVKRDVLAKETLAFDERLHYNEENLLIRQLMAKGYRMIYAPDMAVRHERRKSLAGFARQVFESGKGRAKMTRMAPASFSPSYGMPAVFCAYLVCAAAMPAGPLLLPLALYLAADAVNAVVITVRHRERVVGIPALLLLSPLAHIAYGLGFYAGLLGSLRRSA